MGKLDRAQWRGRYTSLQNAYEKADAEGDTDARKRIYDQIEDHHYSRSFMDRAAGQDCGAAQCGSSVG